MAKLHRHLYWWRKTLKKTPPPFKNKEDYIGDTNERTRESDDYTSETAGCTRNLGEEHKNEEYE